MLRADASIERSVVVVQIGAELMRVAPVALAIRGKIVGEYSWKTCARSVCAR